MYPSFISSILSNGWPYSLWMTSAIGVGLTLFGVASTLIWPIIFPKILSYPWPMSEDYEHRRKDRNHTVVLAGSYNPPHSGHMAMIRYLSERYGQVILVVGVNPNKQYLVSPYHRAELLRRMLKDTPASNVRVEVVKGYVWRHVKQEGAKVFVRGIRSWNKDGHDERSLQILNTWGPLVLGPLWWPLPTLFLEGNPEYNHVSSTLIREICRTKDEKEALEDVSRLVPRTIAEDVTRFYGAEDNSGNRDAL